MLNYVLGLIYLTLFMARKLFIEWASMKARNTHSHGDSRRDASSGDLGSCTSRNLYQRRKMPRSPIDLEIQKRTGEQNMRVLTAYNRATPPPLYALVIVVSPVFGALFISISRAFDFRHHGFDILFGFWLGSMTAIFAFWYYYSLKVGDDDHALYSLTSSYGPFRKCIECCGSTAQSNGKGNVERRAIDDPSDARTSTAV